MVPKNRKLVSRADREEIHSVGLPKVEAGLGKLSWMALVKPLFIEHMTESSCKFFVYEMYAEHEESKQGIG